MILLYQNKRKRRKQMKNTKVIKIDYMEEGIIVEDFGYAVRIVMNNGQVYPRVMKSQLNGEREGFDFIIKAA
jgi:hypothetical protein